MEQFIDILRNNPEEAYNYIADNAYKFSQYELTDIIKELIYGIYFEAEWGLITKADHDKILANTAEELANIYEE